MKPMSVAGAAVGQFGWPLMEHNIERADLDAVVAYLRQNDPMLTHGANVRAFEEEWSEWLGVRHSVMVNSGSSANLLTMSALRQLRGPGEVIVPPLTWVSDIASVLQCGLTPVFADIDRRTLGLDTEQVLEKITDRTRAIFVTHVLGYNALTQRLLDEAAARKIPIIEDACESHGARFAGRKVGTFGWASNFSFYYAHHLSTVEGGMISTDDPDLYQTLRMLRSHGLVREATSTPLRDSYERAHPDLNPDFIFAFPAYNVRPTEIAGVIGRSQLTRLDARNERRTRNFRLFLDHLDAVRYQTDFAVAGSCNYAFTLVLNSPNPQLWRSIEQRLRDAGIEFRRGLSGGGNQLRQPYLRRLLGDREYVKYPRAEHVHFYGCYIGNYPDLSEDRILRLCELLNAAV